MIDIETQKPLQVNSEGDAGPYLMVPLDQLPDVRRILQSHGIAYVLGQDAIQLGGKPIIAVLDFGRDARVALIQAALDAA